MDNYNPRQPTRFRFKDSREIEKFKFFTGNFDFEEQELLENVSQDKKYGPIIEAFKEAIRTDTEIGVILYDGPISQNTFIGFITGSICYLSAISNTSIFIINLEYDNQRDTLSVTNTTEDILVEDNVKTLFGNTISGSGNITLFRHVITLRGTDSNDNTYSTIFTIYSSSNLKINSVQDLNKVLKPTDQMLIPVSTLLEGQHFSKTEYNGMQYNASTQVWKVGSVNSDVAKVSGKSYLQDSIFNVTSISNDEVIAL